MIAAIKKVFLVVVLALPGLFSMAENIPVIPLPRYVSQTATQLHLGNNIAITGIGLSKEALNALKEHWTNTTSVNPYTLNLTLGLLGKDKAFDQLVSGKYGNYDKQIGKEGYLLILNTQHRIIAATTEAGLFYGLQTLKQLIRNKWNRELFIADWPAFEHRVVYDDISRGPISTIPYIKKQIERLAELKINYLSFYIEHVVQPVSYPDFAPSNGKLTIAQIKELSAYAAKYHMQLIGSFQSFGHFEKILSLPRYKDMGETATLISPLDNKAKAFLESVIGELCDAFSAPFFNVNCDETFGLSSGKSKAYVDSVGEAKFYADHLKFLYGIVKRHHKQMMMWGDVALQHEEMLDILSNDIIYLTWEYGDQRSYDAWIKPFVKRKLQFMVCPGILNSYRLFPDMAMAKANIDGFLPAGKKAGATGAFTTIWDDGGLNLFSADWYGVYAAAEKSWNTEPSTEFDTRYEQCAYGVNDKSYVNALFKLMELRSVPITYDLNDQLWKQKLVPDSGRKLIINNSSAQTALKIIEEAEAIISLAKPQQHIDDINTLKFAIAWYRLILESRIAVARQPEQDVIKSLLQRYENLKAQYRQNWLRENQQYWLDKSLGLFDEKIDQLKRLLTNKQITIVESPSFYFQNWMLAGPFNTMPTSLYADDEAYNKPPSPGDFTMYKGKRYKWEKYASENGGVVYLEQNGVSYAYCRITTEQATEVDAFVSSTNGMEVYCNSVKIETVPGDLNKEKKIRLSLIKGVNHVLLKLPSKAFTFRLDDSNIVTNHKHKYQLNAKTQIHEAE